MMGREVQCSNPANRLLRCCLYSDRMYLGRRAMTGTGTEVVTLLKYSVDSLMRPLTQQAGIDTCVPGPVLDLSPALSPGHPDGLPEDHTALRWLLGS